jgi:hypothetical protein
MTMSNIVGGLCCSLPGYSPFLHPTSLTVANFNKEFDAQGKIIGRIAFRMASRCSTGSLPSKEAMGMLPVIGLPL